MCQSKKNTVSIDIITSELKQFFPSDLMHLFVGYYEYAPPPTQPIFRLMDRLQSFQSFCAVVATSTPTSKPNPNSNADALKASWTAATAALPMMPAAASASASTSASMMG